MNANVGAPGFVRLALLAAVLAVVAVSFSPVLHNGFVNWDDPDTIQRNPHLTEPGTVAWAFSTTRMDHYQPLSWLAWSALARQGAGPHAYHGLSLGVHVVNTALVFALAVILTKRAGPKNAWRFATGAVAAILFGIHPLRVEVVAWISAFPYLLATTPLLLSALAYLKWLESAQAGRVSMRAGWLALSIVLFGLSVLSRVVAPAFPIVLLVLERALLASPSSSAGDRPPAPPELRRRVAAKIPLFAITLAGVVIEAGARPLAQLAEVGIGPRVTAAVTMPFLYLVRTVAPLGLTPLDPLSLSPRISWPLLVSGSIGLTGVTFVAWRARTRCASFIVGWITYLLLLAPVVGLTPSGLQATADRYTYVPAIAVAIAVASAMAPLWTVARIRLAIAAGAAALSLVLGRATWQQSRWWHDSISLWSRAVDLNPANDVALYNLGVALAAAGRDDEAAASYERTLRLVPDHRPARLNLTLLEATRYQREADSFAAAGRLNEAIAAYDQVLARDPARLLALAGRGMAKLRLERIADATVDLRKAWAAGIRDAATANALAFALMSSGAEREAGAVLRQALAANPTNGEVAANLARLLATAQDPAVLDPALALRLAARASAEAGDRDPRLLDTLAAAYAGSGDLARGLDASRRAASIARSSGDREMADRIEFNWERYAASARLRRPLPHGAR